VFNIALRMKIKERFLFLDRLPPGKNFYQQKCKPGSVVIGGGYLSAEFLKNQKKSGTAPKVINKFNIVLT
jgi:hypothetical protein